MEGETEEDITCLYDSANDPVLCPTSLSLPRQRHSQTSWLAVQLNRHHLINRPPAIRRAEVTLETSAPIQR